MLRRDRVVFSSVQFAEALSTYLELCSRYWEDHLDAADPEERLAAAWGLVGVDPENDRAVAVLRKEADPEARQRLEALRRKHRTEARAAAGRRSKPRQAA